MGGGNLILPTGGLIILLGQDQGLSEESQSMISIACLPGTPLLALKCPQTHCTLPLSRPLIESIKGYMCWCAASLDSNPASKSETHSAKKCRYLEWGGGD